MLQGFPSPVSMCVPVCVCVYVYFTSLHSLCWLKQEGHPWGLFSCLIEEWSPELHCTHIDCRSLGAHWDEHFSVRVIMTIISTEASCSNAYTWYGYVTALPNHRYDVIPHSQFAMMLKSWEIQFTAFPRTLCIGAPKFFVVLQTDKNILSCSPCAAFLSRHSQYSPCVCVKHQACRTAGAGLSTLRQSQTSVDSDRTVRWPPGHRCTQGDRTGALLPPPSSFIHPPSHHHFSLHLVETNTLSQVHLHTCTTASCLWSLRHTHMHIWKISSINTYANIWLRSNIHEWS